MKKSVFAALPAAALLSLAACGEEAATDEVDVVEDDTIDVDVPEIPAEDVMVPVDPETVETREEIADEIGEEDTVDEMIDEQGM